MHRVFRFHATQRTLAANFILVEFGFTKSCLQNIGTTNQLDMNVCFMYCNWVSSSTCPDLTADIVFKTAGVPKLERRLFLCFTYLKK